jgi:hypothetical protein
VRRRLSRVRGAIGLALVAAASAVAVAFGAGALLDERGPSRDDYLRQVAVVCARYGEQLDLIPPPDASAAGSIYETVGRVLPIVEAQLDEVRAIPPPRTLTRQVDRFVQLTARSIRALKVVRAEAFERDLWGSAQAFTRFERFRNQAQVQGRRIGFHC